MTKKSIPTLAGRDLDGLTTHFLKVFPALDEVGQRLALAVYRNLSQGDPVSPAMLAATTRLPEDEVASRLAGWPGVYYAAHEDWSRTLVCCDGAAA
jgi:hypothetical protein